MDGGWTRVDSYESAVSWDWLMGVGDTCPECAEEWKRLIKQFEKAPPKEEK